jgi:hypothetical protein
MYRFLLILVLPFSISAQKTYISANDTISIVMRSDKKCLTLKYKYALNCCEYGLIIKQKDKTEIILNSGPGSNNNILSFCSLKDIYIDNTEYMTLAKYLYDEVGNGYYVIINDLIELKE